MSLRIAKHLKANNSAAEFKEDYLAQEQSRFEKLEELRSKIAQFKLDMAETNASDKVKQFVEDNINEKLPAIEKIFKGIEVSIGIAVDKVDAQIAQNE